MKKLYILLLMSFIVFLHGCDMIEYHPYDGRIHGDKGINARNIALIEELYADKDTIRFILVSDTQRNYNESEDFVKTVNQRNDIDFVIHGGDFVDFGLTREFEWMRDIMNRLKVPYVGIIGNHDCLANGEEIFRKIYGELNFSFTAGKTKFICLNTNALEYDYSRPVPDFEFMENEYNNYTELQEKTIFVMHVPPFDSQFNNNVGKVFQGFIKEFPNLQFCLHGHTHKLSVEDLFDDGVIYYGTPNIAKRAYLIFTVMPNSEYNYEVVEF